MTVSAPRRRRRRPRLALLFVASTAAFACRKGSSNSSPPSASPSTSSAASASSASSTSDAGFWKWFVTHAIDVASITAGTEPIASELARELHAVDKNLTFEVGRGQAEREIVISADGIQSAFPAVQRLVAAAPKIPGWKVTAFRPRKAMSTIALGDGTTLAAGDVTFRVLTTQGQKVDVEIYVKGAKTITSAIKSTVFLHLDAVLGEYDVETYVGGIEVTPGDVAPEGVMPLAQLAKTVDALKPQ